MAVNVDVNLIKLYCKQLRLPMMMNHDDVLRLANEQGWSYEQFLCELLRRELEQRQANQQKRRIKAARFPMMKSLDEFEFKNLPNVSEAAVWQLATGEFVDKRENIIMIGNPGTGKTHLATGLGVRLCRQGYKVLFFTAANLVTQLCEAQEERLLGKLQRTISKADLLILDELSYLTFSKVHSELLFHILSTRNERGSVIITTNLEFSQWNEIFPDTMLTAALIDRLTHKSHILDMSAESYRLQERLKNQSKR